MTGFELLEMLKYTPKDKLNYKICINETIGLYKGEIDRELDDIEVEGFIIDDKEKSIIF